MQRGAWVAILAVAAAASCHELLPFGLRPTPGADLAINVDAAEDAAPADHSPPPPPTDASVSCQAQGHCFIDGTCHPPGPSTVPCRLCAPDLSQTAWSVARGCVATLAGSGAAGFQNGAAATARFDQPQGVALLDPHTLLVVDNHNHCIRRLDLKAGVVGTFAGICGPCAFGCFANGPASQARFFYPGGVVVAGAEVFVSDTWNHRIRKIASGVVTTHVGTGLAATADGPITSATVNFPEDMALDGAGVLYFVESRSGMLRRIEGGEVTSIQPKYTTAIAGPQGVAVGPSGPVYVADTVGQKVWRVVDGVRQGLAGTGFLGCEDGHPMLACFGHPTGLALTAVDLLVADWLNGRLRRVQLGTGVTSTLAGQSCANPLNPDTPAGGHRDGALAQALFRGPRGLYLDAATGRLFVGDELNHRVRLLVLP